MTDAGYDGIEEFMKQATGIVLSILIAMSCAELYGQCTFGNPPPMPIPRCKVVGRSTITWTEGGEYAGGTMRVMILGNAGNIVPAPNASRRVVADVINLQLGYRTIRERMPIFAFFRIESWSPDQSKYSNSKLTVLADETRLVFESLESRRPAGICEIFYLEIEFDDFLRLTSAKKVTFEIGNTRIPFQADDIRALNELNKTTTDLKPPVRQRGVIYY